MSFPSLGSKRRPSGKLATAAILLLLTLLSTGPRVLGAGWWVNSHDDAQWTNKPLTEIRSEAQRGAASAQFHYARALFLANEVAPDWTDSLRWTRRAAEQGHVEAQFMAARFYFGGTGTARDPDEGLVWASRAANKGHADAIALIADAHAYGQGTNREVAKAIALFRQAIENGSILALDWLGHFYLNGEAGTVERTNYVEALRCFERAASNGMAHAAVHVVEMCSKGSGTPPDPKRALYWARYFVDQDEPELLDALASMYSTGMAEPRGSHETPTELLRRAGERRVVSLQKYPRQPVSARALRPLTKNINELSERYFFGVGTARDYIAASQWLWQATQLSAWQPPNAPGRSPSESPHVFDGILHKTVSARSAETRRLHEAVQLVYRSLNLREPETMRRVGEMYRDGSTLTPQSPLSAWAWLKGAAQLNDASAKVALAQLEQSLSKEQLESAKRRFQLISRQSP